MTAALQRLPNGMAVIADPMPGAQSAAVGLYAAVGSRQEPTGKGGLAHMVEHMVFKGAGNRGARAIAEAIEDVGGSLNAWTARDQTAFHARVLPNDVALAVGLIADLVRAPLFDPDELEREKGVILSELGEILDNPEDLSGDLLFEAAFDGQPLGAPVIGREETIRAFDTGDLHGWLKGQFTPDRLLLVGTGAVDGDTLLRLAEQRFGDLPAAPLAASVAATFTGSSRRQPRRTAQAHWHVGWQAPSGADPAMPAASVFAQAVGGGMSSRLFQQLREERGLAYSIYAWTQGFADTGIMAVSAATDRPDAPAALALARQVVASAAETLDEDEVARAKAQIEASLRMSLERVQGRADHHARSFELFGRLVGLEESLDELHAVDSAAARTAGRRMLDGPVALAAVGGGRLALAA
ncbi:insulinase family protein [Sphingomonas sp. BN140010]|uniref:Insulinase family protein n=1 Tax=Sphingomonas arvum TaxID=2992113 RepID=A0ABT3JBP4_9SPHN|nr:pitrilysin family protein [Sphingomonas sp. BN140010]MCW3796241.1 insulinase family protein [Sphingomonas sp. BN140010]